MKRNHYRVVRRGQKWVVRAKLAKIEDFAEAETWPGPYKVKYVGVHIPNEWHRRYLAQLQDWDYDFWFHTRSEALMFMLRCPIDTPVKTN